MSTKKLKHEVFPTAYLPDIVYMAHFLAAESPRIDIGEHFEKQTCRNRTDIMTTSGKITLSVPVIKKAHHTPTREIGLCYRENWPTMHWRTIKTAYGSSPYFLYYADMFEPFYTQKFDTLLELNQNLFNTIMQIIGLPQSYNYSSIYIESEDIKTDYRNYWHPVKDHILIPKYMQVFEEKYGFMHNLSVLDLIFNLGPEASSYLYHLSQKVRNYFSG